EKEGEEGMAAVADGPPPLTRLEIATPAEDERELEEIDRLIRTAGVATDQDQPVADANGEGGGGGGAGNDGGHAHEFEHEKTREFEAVGEKTRIHKNTIQAPEVVHDEFDRSETTNKKPRPEELDAGAEGADDATDGESEAT